MVLKIRIMSIGLLPLTQSYHVEKSGRSNYVYVARTPS